MNATSSRRLTAAADGGGDDFEIALNMVVFCMASSFAVGACLVYAARRARVEWIPEAGIYLAIGILAGLVIRLADHVHVASVIEKLSSFDAELFYTVFLPPIVFQAGYSMRLVRSGPARALWHRSEGPLTGLAAQGFFFANFGAICALAFAGTGVATLLTGILLYAASAAGLVSGLSFLNSLVFGALISATDPVSVLAVFSDLGVDPMLYALVFGESVLNDAVAIVLYRTLTVFQDSPVTAASVLGALGMFVGIFLGSLLIGLLLGGISALVFKRMALYRPENALVERALMFGFPYMAYFLAEGVRVSGIVSILFCGIAMAHYTR